MTTSKESPARSDGKSLPADGPLHALMEPLRDVLEAVGEAQRRSEHALRRILEATDSLASASAAAPAETVGPAVDDGAPADPDASTPPPAPSVPEALADEPVAPVPVAPAPAASAPTAPAPAASPPAAASPAPLPSRPSTEHDASPRPGVAARETPSAEPAAPAADAPTVRRKLLLELQQYALEIDRLVDPERTETYLWEFARSRGLRSMLLQERGRSLYAQDAVGFTHFEGERKARLKKVVVPFDPEGVFAATATERAPYSGPRPSRGIPVDLVLVMGKQKPVWTVIVPLPYRNRWGTFLYVDADAAHLPEILLFEHVARLVVLQLRGSRHRPHEPAERVRQFRTQTLKDRKRRRERDRRDQPAASEASTETQGTHDPLSKKKGAAPSIRLDPDSDRLDAEGRLIRPLDGAAILARVGELPPMPQVAGRLLTLLNDPETEIARLQEVISTDQALSVRLLQIANSSLYSHMHEAKSIGEAVVRLGFTAIRSWVLASVTRTVFLHEDASVSIHRLWRQSVVTALAAQLLAERTGAMDPDEAFVGGLTQNVGLLLLARNHPQVFEEIEERAREGEKSYFEVERELLGFDHADISGIVLGNWQLTDTLVEAVASHHRLGSAGESVLFAAIIALAEELALRVAEGPTETSADELIDTPAATHLGIDASQMAEVEQSLADRILDRELFSD